MADQEVSAKFTADISDFESKMGALTASAASAEEATASLSASGSAAAGGISEVGGASTEASAAADEAVASFMGLSSATEESASSTKEAASSSQEAGGGFIGMAMGAMQAVQQVQQFIQIVGQVISWLGQEADAAMNTAIAFNTLTGNAELAQSAIQNLNSSAAAADYGKQTIDNAAALLMRLGVNSDDAQKQVLLVADALAAAGGNGKQLDPVLLKMHDIQSQTKVTTKDIDTLSKDGIDAWQALADGMGVSIDEAKRRVQEGTVSGKQAFKDLEQGMQQWSGSAEAQSNEFGATWQKTMSDLAHALEPALKAFTALLKLIDDGIVAINKLHDAIGTVEENPFFSGFMSGLTHGFSQGEGIPSLGGLLGFASGGTNLPQGWRVAGEEGPELQYSPGGDTIIPNGTDPTSFLGGSALSSIGPMEIHVHVHPQPMMIDSRVLAEQTFQHFSPMIRQVTGRRQ
jgi:tape measure domain-containing protein